ncbi:hypothetical protein D3C86_1843020 [compost metagenome]
MTRLTLWPVSFSKAAIRSLKNAMFLPVELAAMESSAACAETAADSTLPHSNKVFMEIFIVKLLR